MHFYLIQFTYMKPLIVANWKLNPETQKEAKALFDAVKKGAKNASAEVVICPPFIYLAMLDGLALGAQNVSTEKKGAFTGEVSAMQLKDLGVEYVIIGHSERRHVFFETDEIINKKVKVALEAGLKVILCVGEKDGQDKAQMLEQQITSGLAGVTGKEIKHVVVAYEPVWAIGTGKNCGVDETMSSLMLIRKIIANAHNREVADGLRILYGGSVKPENAVGYLTDAGANGLLVGGASLKAEEFVGIIKAAE